MIISRIAALVSMSTPGHSPASLGAFHDARLLLELAPDFLDHRAAARPTAVMEMAAEQIGQQAAEEEAGHHIGIGQ